jgi:DNA-binding beta-propeller fold protein YncE
MAVSIDGTALLLSRSDRDGSHAIHETNVVDGSPRRVLDSRGDGPLQFMEPQHLCVASDGFVFVADYGNNRVQVLTPSLDFHRFIGQGQLSGPVGVCASAVAVVVSELYKARVTVFDRGDGALLRRIGSYGSCDGQLRAPQALCFMSGDRHVAVSDQTSDRVSVFSVEGEFIRHVGVGVLHSPLDVAASAFDELVVADSDSRCLRVFSSTGDLLASVGAGHFTGVAVHGSTVFAMQHGSTTVSVRT